jgi:hypothetical protein
MKTQRFEPMCDAGTRLLLRCTCTFLINLLATVLNISVAAIFFESI